jgi:hypothetical protein
MGLAKIGLNLQALFMPDADVAQLVEQLIRNEKVEGSTPFIGTTNSCGPPRKKVTFRSGLFCFRRCGKNLKSSQ